MKCKCGYKLVIDGVDGRYFCANCGGVGLK